MNVVPLHHVAALEILLKHQRRRGDAPTGAVPVGPALDVLADAQPRVPHAQRHRRRPRGVAAPQLDVRDLLQRRAALNVVVGVLVVAAAVKGVDVCDVGEGALDLVHAADGPRLLGHAARVPEPGRLDLSGEDAGEGVSDEGEGGEEERSAKTHFAV